MGSPCSFLATQNQLGSIPQACHAVILMNGHIVLPLRPRYYPNSLPFPLFPFSSWPNSKS